MWSKSHSYSQSLFPVSWVTSPLRFRELELLLALLFTSPLGYSLNLEARAFIKGFKETNENFFVSELDHGVTKSQTQLSDTHTHHYTHMHPTHHTHTHTHTHTHPKFKDNNTGEE